MTRINVVPPHELNSKHLLAEYRELPRVFGYVRRYQERGYTPADLDIPPEYTMGKGHMKFFYPRLLWLLGRQLDLITEMRIRGYRTTYSDPKSLAKGLKAHWMNDWEVTPQALAINRRRIADRLAATTIPSLSSYTS